MVNLITARPGLATRVWVGLPNLKIQWTRGLGHLHDRILSLIRKRTVFRRSSSRGRYEPRNGWVGRSTWTDSLRPLAPLSLTTFKGAAG
jgi:hypothetical protein